METILLVMHVLVAAGLIGLILIQHGKGADAGAAFGSGASSTVFGSRGSGSFLSRLTAVLATLFFVISLALAILANRGKPDDGSVVDSGKPGQTTEQAAETPVPPGEETGDKPAPPSEPESPDVPLPPAE